MKTLPLFLTVCLLASFGCDIDNVGLSTETLTVTVTTVGTNLDANGYILAITAEQDEPIGINETKVFTVLSTTITVELQDIAANCISSPNPRTVDVRRGSARVEFFVQCN